MTERKYNLRIPDDPFTRHAFSLGSARCNSTNSIGEYHDVYVGGGNYGTIAIGASDGADETSNGLTFGDLCVYGAICASAAEGKREVPMTRILTSLCYANPNTSGMKATAARVAESITKMCSLEVAMPAVHDADGVQLLKAVPRTTVITGTASKGALHLACDGAGTPLGALPLFSRAQQMRQVIGVEPQQMPSFSGRRASLLQRQMAIYVICRALERGTGNVILMDTLLADLGVAFASSDAGYHQKGRCLKQLEATLASMAEQGTVICGYELERRPNNSVRSMSIKPARRAVSNSHHPNPRR